MNWIMIVLRIIHIFSGVFWMGMSIFNVQYLQPTVAATGAEGQKVMQYIARSTNLTAAVYTTSTLVVLSGLTMYGIISGGFQVGFITSAYGLTLAVGGLFAIATWLIVIIVVRGIFTQMAGIGQQIQAQGGPPTAEQGAAMRALTDRLASIGRIGVGLLMVALLAMSIAQYVGF